MPTIDTLDGIDINVYSGDHNPPHIHAVYNEHEVRIDLKTGKPLIGGTMPIAQLRKINKWLRLNMELALTVFKALNTGVEKLSNCMKNIIMKTKAKRLPRILKINEWKGHILSVLFNNGQDRILDFERILRQLAVTKKSAAYKLFDESEFKQVTLNNYTLSWPNVITTIELKNGTVLSLPYEIGADVLFKWSEPDIQREDLKIGDMLKSMRIKAGLTQNEVAYLSGTSRTYISRIENNQSDIELFTLEKIVKAGFNKKLKLQIV